MARRKFIGGNWKMNGTLELITEFSKNLDTNFKDVDVFIAPPLPYLLAAKEKFVGTLIQIASQNFNSIQDKGAFTGQINIPILKDCNVEWTILGHSECRKNESIESINERFNFCKEAEMNVIFCIGEDLQSRNAGLHESVIKRQLEGCKWMDKDRVVIAYEPVWAIGTGIHAESNQILEAHSIVRNILAEKFGDKLAEATRVVYGGSVNSKNSTEIGSLEGVDGFLIGGASLKPDEFKKIISNMQKS